MFFFNPPSETHTEILTGKVIYLKFASQCRVWGEGSAGEAELATP